MPTKEDVKAIEGDGVAEKTEKDQPTAKVEKVATPKPSKKVKSGQIRNKRKNGPVRCGGIDLAPRGSKGDTVTLTEKQLADPALMVKIRRNAASGMIEMG